MKKIRHKFVEIIPESIQPDVLYISIPYNTTIHLCFCGCGNEVALPLSPHDWELIFNGDSVSLYPSIGSWALPCQSHYWIRNSQIKWAPAWSKEQIKRARRNDVKMRETYFDKRRKSFFDYFREF